MLGIYRRRAGRPSLKKFRNLDPQTELRVLYSLMTSLDEGTKTMGFDHKFFERDLIEEGTSMPDLCKKAHRIQCARHITAGFTKGQQMTKLKSIPYYIQRYNKSFEDFIVECHPESMKYTIFANAFTKEHVTTVLTYFYSRYAPANIKFYFNPIMD